MKKNSVAWKSKNEVINVFNQTEFDNSSETETSLNHTFIAAHAYFSNTENFAHKPAIHYSSMNFDIDDEFSAKNVTLLVNYASSVYLCFYFATIPRKYSSALMPKIVYDAISAYPILQKGWHAPQKINPQKNQLPNISKISLGKIK